MANINEILPRGIVREYMTSPILSVYNDATVKEVANFMSSHKTSVVLVKNKTHRYTGVVTDNDFTHKVAVKAYSVNTTTIESVLSAPIKAAMARCLWQMQTE